MDMQMDPASALERISGVYEEAISQEDALREKKGLEENSVSKSGR
ncbi:hypothetical protein [Enterocloster clostridioformis]|nr:hypothetical protein [Enterocloster clostridioformis]